MTDSPHDPTLPQAAGAMTEREIEEYVKGREDTGQTADVTGHVSAPWTAEQVISLNRYQREARFHPFTCMNRGDGRHRTTRDVGVLRATPDGWVCDDCSYRQSWAHLWMADFTWLRHEQELQVALRRAQAGGTPGDTV